LKQQCKLCLSIEALQESQIIPQSIFNVFQTGTARANITDLADLDKLKIYNSGPKDKLLCQPCEQFLSTNYHQYDADGLTNPQQTQVELSNSEYDQYYLYLLSILWLSSVSTLTEFSEIDFPNELESLLQACIRNQTMKLDDTLSIDDFFKISISRLVDNTDRFEDKLIKKLITTFIQTVNDKDQTVFYFIADGFLIEYIFIVDLIEAESSISSQDLASQNTKTLTIANAEITAYPELISLISELSPNSQQEEV